MASPPLSGAAGVIRPQNYVALVTAGLASGVMIPALALAVAPTGRLSSPDYSDPSSAADSCTSPS